MIMSTVFLCFCYFNDAAYLSSSGLVWRRAYFSRGVLQVTGRKTTFPWLYVCLYIWANTLYWTSTVLSLVESREMTMRNFYTSVLPNAAQCRECDTRLYHGPLQLIAWLYSKGSRSQESSSSSLESGANLLTKVPRHLTPSAPERY